MPSTRGRDPAVEEEFLGALYKGGELLASGKIVEAREHLEKAHGLAPKNEKAQNLLGLTYFKLGLYDRASEVYEKLVDDNPADPTLRVNLGLVYLKTNNLERCIKEFETATDLEPAHKKAHNYLGLALAQQGSYARAKEHFELAGSDQMAEKMGRAIANQSSPSGITRVLPQKPATVVLGAETPPPATTRPPPPPAEEIEVMSDEEPPSDAFVVPEDAAPASAPPPDDALNSDWGAALPEAPAATAASPADDLRFAEDEGPSEAQQLDTAAVEELPVLDAVVEVMPVETASADDVEVELMPDTPLDASAEVVDATEAPAEAPPPPPQPSAPTPAWLTTESADAAPPEATPRTEWVTESVADVPLEPEAAPPPPADRWAAANAETASWESEAAPDAAQGPLPPMEMPAVATSDSQAEASGETLPQSVTHDASWAAAAADDAAEPASAADDASWATGPADAVVEPPSVADDASWATGPADAAAPVEPATADDASWATGTGEPAAWATGATAAEPAVADDASWATGAAVPTTPDDDSWATADAASAQPLEESRPVRAAAPQPALDPAPPPEPSAPLPITVEEPAEAPHPVAPPAGYAPMQPQRLVELGASGAWVQDASSGPFHLSNDGLAVTVNGEMLVRMTGLIAVVGSVNVTPENRRRRGRPSSEPFGAGPSQLQRVSGNGVVYLEPGKAKFHAVDLTDQNGVSIDDDGAYLREELVYAFEEPISFENGKLSNEQQSIELAHLKGNGRVLLQLDGTLKAMPIPVGAPLVVPVQRMVGWFGRVTPRLMGFGGRGAVELTGEGYALLGSPAERA